MGNKYLGSSFDEDLGRKLKNPEWAKGYQQEVEKLNIAIQIASLREKKGLTQKQLAEKIGTTQSVISRIENSNFTNFKLLTLTKIAQALGGQLKILLVAE